MESSSQAIMEMFKQPKTFSKKFAEILNFAGKHVGDVSGVFKISNMTML